ncbi:MAG TPA: hypothetical protein VFG45_02970 [Candidatus Nitrosocosmicus sp.]|nr:hypothetical protein [Candidatus Nitrosocosmicus sp.]
MVFFITPDTASLFRINAINDSTLLTSLTSFPLSISNQNGQKIGTNDAVVDEQINKQELYSNSIYNIKINYPDGWTINDGDKATIFHNQSKNLNVVAEIMALIQSSYYDSKIGASHNSLRLIV